MSGDPRTRRTQKELKSFGPQGEIVTDEGDSFTVSVDNKDMFKWHLCIVVPEEEEGCTSVYAGGTFFLSCEFKQAYPVSPPTIQFTTKIYHCNVNQTGELCLDMIKEGWKPAYTIRDILQAIRTLMDCPNPDSPLIPEIGTLYKSNIEEFNRLA